MDNANCGEVIGIPIACFLLSKNLDLQWCSSILLLPCFGLQKSSTIFEPLNLL